MAYSRFSPLFLLPLLLATACTSADSDLCQEAIDLVQECTGVQATYPVEGCIGSYEKQAEAVVAGGCAELNSDKSDTFLCSPLFSWLGQCPVAPLSQVSALESVDDVCPTARADDPLCVSLRSADRLARLSASSPSSDDKENARVAWQSAIDEARKALLADADTARRDPAYRYLLRERTMSLLVYNVLTELGSRPAPSDYATQAQRVISEHFPGYEEGAFPLALLEHAPQTTEHCTSDNPQGLLIFPGVVRLTERDEFSEQAQAIESALSCFHVQRVETGSFVEPSINADQGELAAAALSEEFGNIPLHTLGYSQGATNSLTTLVNKPDISARVRSVLVMNSAAHGSEVADVGASILNNVVDQFSATCSNDFIAPLCESALADSPIPSDYILELMAQGMGVPVGTVNQFIAAEDQVSNAPSLREFFLRHLPGIESLTTNTSDSFWAQRSSELPQNTLYYSFRSVISDTSANLPPSNALFHSHLGRIDSQVPYNDMQVRLKNQSLGDSVAQLEVVGPVAEGNHWQWELATGAVPEDTMPASMTDRIPHREILVGYFQTLVEFGVTE